MGAGDLQVIVLMCAALCPLPEFAGDVCVLLAASLSDLQV
jgi:hypothetical protein